MNHIDRRKSVSMRVDSLFELKPASYPLCLGGKSPGPLAGCGTEQSFPRRTLMRLTLLNSA